MKIDDDYMIAVNGDGDTRRLRWHSLVPCLEEVRARCVRDWKWKLPCWVSIQTVFRFGDQPPFGEIAGSLFLRDDGVVVFSFTGNRY